MDIPYFGLSLGGWYPPSHEFIRRYDISLDKITPMAAFCEKCGMREDSDCHFSMLSKEQVSDIKQRMKVYTKRLKKGPMTLVEMKALGIVPSKEVR